MTDNAIIPTPQGEMQQTEAEVRDALNLLNLREHVLTTEATPDNLHTLYCLLNNAKAFVKELEKLLDASAFEYIEECGAFTIGTERYYIATEKVTKCRDVKATLEKLLNVFDGDLIAVAECLGSSAWKYGQVRNALEHLPTPRPEVFDELFEVTEKRDVKTGKPEKSVKKIDTTFLPKK